MWYMVWIQTNANRLITHDTLTFEVLCQNKKWSCMYYEQVLLNRLSQEILLCSGRLDRSQSYDAPPPPPRPRHEESARFHRQFRQSWQRLYRNQIKNRLFAYPGVGRLCLIKKSQNGGWQAGAWTRTTSKTPGRGSWDHWSPLPSSPPLEACWSAAKSASVSAASSPKNLKK